MAPQRGEALVSSTIVDWIVRKRDGGELEPEQIQQLVERFLEGQVTDYQLSAWLMAVFFQA